MSKIFKFVDLFCGIGSFHYSLQKLDGECVLASDINSNVQKTYETNYGMKIKGDIYDIKNDEIPEFDVLCAGIPCQPFSNIGKHKGFDDDRGTLIHQVIRFLKHREPKAFIIENVKGLLSHKQGNTFAKVKSLLEDCGYIVSHKVLCCDDYGIPQMRKRLFIVGTKDKPFDFENIKKKKTPTLGEYMNKDFKKQCAYTIRCGGRKSKINDRHNWDSYYVGETVYTLNVEDMKKLQGFPECFVLEGYEKQKETMLGNTIPTNMTYAVGEQLLTHL